MRYFTSDTHFGHRNIIRYCDRPFRDVSHMNQVLINNWNQTVKATDEVFHLGDVALGPWEDWDNILPRLNGFKTLVVGNHDRIFKGESEKRRARFEEHYARWFDVVVDEVTGLRLMGEHTVNLSHFPYDGDSHDGDRYTDFRLPDLGVTLIHGHTHLDQVTSRSNKGALQVHVGVDAWNYRPVSEKSVSDIITRHLGE